MPPLLQFLWYSGKFMASMWSSVARSLDPCALLVSLARSCLYFRTDGYASILLAPRPYGNQSATCTSRASNRYCYRLVVSGLAGRAHRAMHGFFPFSALAVLRWAYSASIWLCSTILRRSTRYTQAVLWQHKAFAGTCLEACSLS